MTNPSALYNPPESAVRGAQVSGMAAYKELCAQAAADYMGYWSRLARELVSWKTPFTKGLDESNAPFCKWFEDGTLFTATGVRVSSSRGMTHPRHASRRRGTLAERR